MGVPLRLFAVLSALCFLAAGVRLEAAAPPGKPAPPTPRKAVERGLVFLQEDAAKWRKERTCSTCHHGTMTVWALAEAKSQGYAVAPEKWADVLKWTKDRLD